MEIQNSDLMEKHTAVQNADLNIGENNMKFCPRCGSPNVDWVLPQTWSKWECKACGWTGGFIVEDGKMAEGIRKEYLKKQTKDDKSK